MAPIPSPYKEVLDDLLSRLRESLGDELISFVVYGSVARGDFRKDSDIDILIICKELPESRFKRQELFIRVEDTLDLEELRKEGFYPDFSPVMKTMDEAKFLTPLYLDMVGDAVILYDAGDFFKKILDKLRTSLKKQGAKRVSVGKKWYWDLKPGLRYGEVVVIE